ncbi:RICIN domain-containing protein [Actinoalloteichus fjordicus]|uniref:RICIN domain-containing protein n=1 Tax=Actinoalloteichus fjordicus TaxID=1612552 RepID=UPI0009527F38|nr:RICIN domain-containing protein [Actinoalloteichus fjordicus]
MDAATGTATVEVPARSVATLAVSGVSGVAEDAATIRDGRDYRLTGVGSGRSLTVAADGTGTEIRTPVDGNAAQAWRLTRVADSAEDLSNRARYVVTTADTDRRPALRDDEVGLEDAQGQADAAAQWIGSTTGDGTWTLINAEAGLLLEVSGEATHDGAEVSVWTPNSGARQRWQVIDETDPAGS